MRLTNDQCRGAEGPTAAGQGELVVTPASELGKASDGLSGPLAAVRAADLDAELGWATPERIDESSVTQA
jgi:hypothetical protein